MGTKRQLQDAFGGFIEALAGDGDPFAATSARLTGLSARAAEIARDVDAWHALPAQSVGFDPAIRALDQTRELLLDGDMDAPRQAEGALDLVDDILGRETARSRL